MSWKPRRKKWPWRKYLTPEEAEFIRRSDAAISAARAVANKVATEFRPQRTLIVNRAIQRAKYEALP